jgi:Flp pilus assembly protein TadD
VVEDPGESVEDKAEKGQELSSRKKKTEKTSTARVAERPRQERAKWLIPIVLVLAGVIAYSNSFSGPFIFDDIPSTIDNPHIKHLWPLTEAMTAVSQTATAGRPVPTLSLTLNYAFGGFNVWGYHAVNLALHILAALTLFGLMRRTLADETNGLWLAGSVALLWELHPLNTESVTYVVQRTELFVGLFLLLTLYCLARGWHVAAIVACALGMGSKEVMAGAPIIALLYDYVFLSKSWRKVWDERKWVHLGLALTWIVLIGEIAAGSRQTTVGFEFANLGAWDYLKTQCSVILHYLRLCVWPSPLVIDYQDWPIAKGSVLTIVPAWVLLALASATLWLLFKRPRAGFLGACFFIILAPSSSFVPIASEIVAERRMYLPLAAVVGLIVIGGYFLVRQVLPQMAALILVGIVSVVFAAVTYQRNLDYRSELAIWEDGASKRPGNPRAHENLGLAFKAVGKDDEAMKHFQIALRLFPGYADAMSNVGALLGFKGRGAEAIPYFVNALKKNPKHVDARFNLAVARHGLGNLDEAEKGYRELLKDVPTHIGAHNNLAGIFLSRGKTAEAIAEWNEVLRLDPTHADARKNLDFVQKSQAK